MLYETQLAALWLGDTTLIEEVSLVSTGFELVTKRTSKHVFLEGMSQTAVSQKHFDGSLERPDNNGKHYCALRMVRLLAD